MVIATRTLKLRQSRGDVQIPIHVFAPEREDSDWSCKFEIGWPGEKLTRSAAGIDAVHALELALQMIGAQIYASDYHEARQLEWLEPGNGYGFPVPNSMRHLLTGDDRRFL